MSSRLNGTFTTHNKYGYQFQVDSFEIVLPEKWKRIYKWRRNTRKRPFYSIREACE